MSFSRLLDCSCLLKVQGYRWSSERVRDWIVARGKQRGLVYGSVYDLDDLDIEALFVALERSCDGVVKSLAQVREMS